MQDATQRYLEAVDTPLSPNLMGESKFILEKVNKRGFNSDPWGQWQTGVRLKLKQRDEVKIYVQNYGTQLVHLILLPKCRQPSLSNRRTPLFTKLNSLREKTSESHIQASPNRKAGIKLNHHMVMPTHGAPLHPPYTDFQNCRSVAQSSI